MTPTTAAPLPAPARLRLADVARLGVIGITGRPIRAALSAAGIAIGVAAMIAVLGIGTSSRASLLNEIQQLGTNLLTAQPGQSLLGGTAQLPDSAVPMANQVAGVQAVSAVGTVQGAAVYRTDLISPYATSGISVDAAELNLLPTLHGSVALGIFLNAANDRYPVTVLGASAANRLGVTQPGGQVYLGGRWFTVIGILSPLPLASAVDNAALVGWPAAQSVLGFNGNPSTVYVRATDTAVNRTSLVLAATVDPQYPEDVQVTRPSDALTAELAAKSTFNSLFLGLGAVALLVGGIGVANIMVISVLERRQEIGLRRALGATAGHVRAQFLTESVLLALLGGIAGVAAGTAIAASYAADRGWPVTVPWQALAGGVAASVVIGGGAGLYPARRASRVSPAVALATG